MRENYVNIVKDPSFWKSLGRTFLYLICTVTGEVVLGFFVAYVFDKQELYNLLDNVRDNNFMLPFSVFAGYSGCLDDIINYGHDSDTSFNLLYNNKAELIIRKI